jgi:hypothetical protein
MSDEKKKDNKDLTGILELSSLLPPQSAEELLSEDPFSNTLPPVEQVDDFESIDQMGMIDHAQTPEKSAEEAASETTASTETSTFAEVSLSTDFDIEVQDESQTGSPHETATPENLDFMSNAIASDGTSDSNNPGGDFPASVQDPFTDSVQEIKNYSERARETSFQSDIKNPFHLWILGNFDPFSRDKLLLFITDNPMGLNSSDLDRQITGGRVLLPRISEFAGIKLIQDLKDSGLAFKLQASSRDEDEVLPQSESLRLHYESEVASDLVGSVVVLATEAIDPKLWQAFDSIQVVQFLKAEIVEVERSEIFQELLDRMTTSLKHKARLKGAAAIGSLVHELKPLRLPSHYQLEVKANLLKKL